MAYNNRVNPIPNKKQNENKKGNKNMNIIASNKPLSPRDTYALTRDAKIQKMTNAVGHTLDVDLWLLYEDVSVTRSGEVEERKVLSIRDKTGRTFATISPTFIDEFGAMCEIFENELPPICVISSTSKAGREFITCALAD